MSNSSGARERFTLAAGQSKVFTNGFFPDQPVGAGNFVQAEIEGLFDQTPAGVPIDDGGTTILLETSEDDSSWSTVATQAVKAMGKTGLQGKVGGYFRIRNSGAGFATVVASPASGLVQLVPGL